MIYWMDANVFIQCRNRVYTFERYPEFWAFISEQIDAQSIRSSHFVWKELCAGGDMLANWAKARKETALNTIPSQSVQENLKQILDFVEADNKYQSYRRTEFYYAADPWLIAHARESGGTVVTHETPRETGKIKVSGVCHKLNVDWIDVYDLQDLLNYNPGKYRS